MSDTGQPPSSGTPDPSVPPTEPMPVTPPPGSGPVLPPTEPVPPGGAVPPGGTIPPGGTVPPGPPPEGPWYENRTAMAVVVVTALALLFFLIAFFIWWGSDGDDDEVVIDPGPITSGTVLSSSTVDTSTTSTTAESTTSTTTSTTTTTTTTTTTLPPTTTTTTTEAPTTTAAPTTVAPTTTIPEIVVPPQSEPNVWDIIVNSPDLGRARELFELAGLDAVLSDPDLVVTVFVPTDQAIEAAAGGQGAPDLSDPDVVRPILEAHLHLGDAFASLDGLTEITVENGGPQPVTADPPTFGDIPRPASVVVSEPSGANGVIHVIDQVVAPQP